MLASSNPAWKAFSNPAIQGKLWLWRGGRFHIFESSALPPDPCDREHQLGRGALGRSSRTATRKFLCQRSRFDDQAFDGACQQTIFINLSIFVAMRQPRCNMTTIMRDKLVRITPKNYAKVTKLKGAAIKQKTEIKPTVPMIVNMAVGRGLPAVAAFLRVEEE
jgi:hypothetical protein